MRMLSITILFSILGCTTQDSSETRTLDLSNANLTAIPDSVFSLIKLEYLNVGNSFTLYPPLSALGTDSMTDMNQISQIQKEISRLRHLKVLNLRANNLKSLPKEILKLEELDTLDISFNKHFALAAQLITLKKMQWLSYLNVAGTDTDQRSIEELRKSLPQTRIVARLEDMIIESTQ